MLILARYKMKLLSASLLLFITFLVSANDEPSLLIYGDSISAGYGMKKDQQWSESLKILLKDNNIKLKVFNKSISGETTGGGLSRIYKILDELNPTYLLLELGGNDALRGYPPEKIYQNLNKMIQAAKSRNIEVFLMQIRILPNYGKRYQTQFESVYPKAAADSDVTLIPFMLKNIALEKKLMLPDGIHPNQDAQPLIASFVLKSLKPHIK